MKYTKWITDHQCKGKQRASNGQKRLCRSSCKRLLEILDDIVDMLGADGNTNGVFRGAGGNAFLVRELFVRRRPRVNR